MENRINSQDNMMLTLPAVAMRDVVVMPHMSIQFDVIRERSINALSAAMKSGRYVFLTSQKDVLVEEPAIDDVYTVGVVAVVKQLVAGSDGVSRVLVEGKRKAYLQSLYVTGGRSNYLECECLCVENYAENIGSDDEVTAIMREVKRVFKGYTDLMPGLAGAPWANARAAKTPVELFERIAFNIPLATDTRQELLEISSADKKLFKLINILTKEITLMKLENDIRDHVAEQFDKLQKEQYLREMKNAISHELGELGAEDDELDDDDKYYNQIIELGLDPEREEKLLSELKRMRKMPQSSHEAALISEYLDTCISLPWNSSTEEVVDTARARQVLDRDHYGLKKVKERILETIAVRQLSPQVKGQIICLYGPPGVGKTSIGRSIAEALNRKYVRVSLGGVRDEADIRGHRKTYIGAMPGRIMDALKKCGSNNPVMLLDEIDKLTSDAHGDPSSALLEVLDSEQNIAFRDHYIELPFDLSRVMFITTANTLDTIQPPLLDRMEVIELGSYTREEKFQIAKKHLFPKQLSEHGLSRKNVKLADSAIYALIDFYTKEAGVRKLERAIAALCRKAAAEIVGGETEKVSFTMKNLAKYLGTQKYLPDTMTKKDAVGEVNGLAWTSVGGVLMPLEVITLDGKGTVEATGSLGDVMKESAKIAVSYCRSVAKQYGIDQDFYKSRDIHIHAPEGAVPKDGPSAGVTLITALISALSGIPVRHDVAMTGEITLTGRVLAIGGLREKTMAAYKNGIKTVIVPKANMGDLDEIDETVKNGLEFIFAERIADVLDAALVKKEKKASPKIQTQLGSKAPKRIKSSVPLQPTVPPSQMQKRKA